MPKVFSVPVERIDIEDRNKFIVHKWIEIKVICYFRHSK